MTFLEKARELKPDYSDDQIAAIFCPYQLFEKKRPVCWTDKGNVYKCRDCWNREMPDVSDIEDSITPEKIEELKKVGDSPRILDSGNRREFETGAVRDIQEGKGRCDLLPLDIALNIIPYNCHHCSMLICISNFKDTGNTDHLYEALEKFGELFFKSRYTMLLEVAIHFEEGAKKYGEDNWQKGIPVRCYIDSAVRHYLKCLRGDKDEPHDRAFVWNLMCAIWTCKPKPELNDYAKNG